MNILFDLGHPAHFHLFRICIRKLKDDGQDVIITAKDQPMLIALLQAEKLDYINLGKKGKGFMEKGMKQIGFDLKILGIAIKHKIDLGIGVSMSVPHAALFSRMRSILTDDDDLAITPLFYRFAHRFAGCILSPSSLSWQKGEGKYIYYDGFHELAYLHPAQFTPDPSIPLKLGLNPGDRYFILRFNAFEAYHDTGESGFQPAQKEVLIEKLSEYGRVFISGEHPSGQFKAYKIDLPAWEMHSFMAFSTLFISDSQTMTSEACMLGIPCIRMNSFAGRVSTLDELERKYNLTFSYHPVDFGKLLLKVEELLHFPNLLEVWQIRRKEMLKDKIDVSDFLVWFILNFPGSAAVMRSEPGYQDKFKASAIIK